MTSDCPRCTALEAQVAAMREALQYAVLAWGADYCPLCKVDIPLISSEEHLADCEIGKAMLLSSAASTDYAARIRAEHLEEAATVAEETISNSYVRERVAEHIRALKEKP